MKRLSGWWLDVSMGFPVCCQQTVREEEIKRENIFSVWCTCPLWLLIELTSNNDLKYGLHADRTILCALHVCPSHANVTYMVIINGKWPIRLLLVFIHCLLICLAMSSELTSVKLFSSRKWRNDVTIFVWKSFHFKKNCWSDMLGRSMKFPLVKL